MVTYLCVARSSVVVCSLLIEGIYSSLYVVMHYLVIVCRARLRNVINICDSM